MRRLFCLFALLAILLFAAVPSYAASQDAPSTPDGQTKILGIVPTRGNTPVGTQAVNNLINHGGPVMHTNRTYAIFWVPSGFTMTSTYRSIITKFLQDVAADSGKTSNVYYSTTQYSSILYSSTFGGSYVDTAAFPASGCTDSVSATTVCLSDAQLRSEISRIITLNGWPRGAANMYFMFTAKNAGSCYSAGSCAFSAYCAYHSSFGTGTSKVIYANQPYADTVASACDAGQRPNGNDADATINVTSHEHAEAITDYDGNAWYDIQGEENGDKCAWNFGTPLGSTSFGQYNQVIGTGKYYLQQEWSNRRSGCVLTGT